MEAPSVRYVDTVDGFKIGYTVSGDGPILVYMPFPIGNIGRDRRDVKWGQNPQLARLAEKVCLVRYDHRGQGTSTRGLKPNHTLRAYERDLEAVLDRFAPEPIILMATGMSAHVAVRYAVRNPGRLRGLILYRSAVIFNHLAAFNHDLAVSDWDLFLNSFLTAAQANEQISPEERRIAIASMKAAVTQADWLEYARVAETSNIEAELPLIQTPTLVLETSGSLTIAREEATKLASLIPNARLVPVDELGAMVATAQPVLDFVSSLPGLDARAPALTVEPQAGLSPRELEVLRLVAGGNSNREVAQHLVVSVRTVERHITNIYAKINARGKADATAYAFRHSLV